MMDKADIAHLFETHGPVSFRKMFGGTAIYIGSRIVGMDMEGALLIKGDEQTRPAYEQGGLIQWGYSHAKTGKQVRMPYWTVPPEALDDRDQLERWAGLAWQAAVRAK
jgi:DNA transformation protein and related proteins